VWDKDAAIPPLERIGDCRSSSGGSTPVSAINNRVVGFAALRKWVNISTQALALEDPG
jgi:hypothetical protein